MRHAIASVKFTAGKPSGAAPLECTCEARMTSAEWDEHRGMSRTQLRVARAHAAYNERQAAGR